MKSALGSSPRTTQKNGKEKVCVCGVAGGTTKNSGEVEMIALSQVVGNTVSKRD